MEETTPRNRYSDEELQEFKAIILEKIEQAKHSYELLKGGIMSDETTPTFKVLEEGAATLRKEEASQRAQRQMEFIKKLQAALVRIENKTYGVCRITGKLIPKGRLMAVPHTTLSVEGKEIEQQRKQR
ncbi:MAG: TraR/DksA C4-type zinc finger protein [Muribaculaceae bacterium]|jgi:RNA polymerase-binding transcription factor DksA|nr:TraR/DksA C4-type zinc finger protein [Muribaculaceae bacterium]MBQ2235271.1 TraR/DksA C4-type zinc finger protein [Muribaculaceae bacterium]MBQ2484190.1 TraR/DksA C4-type zinc finger protein [Muribaculaceae bacterium]MBQ4005967.1 TraR/DksA C4-type zinc finger protein [Muribaculaceae bacterium]